MVNLPFIAASLLLVPVPVPGQQPGSAVRAPDQEALQQRADILLEMALGKGQARAILAELLEAAPHRLSGSEGAERAVAWGIAKMKALGFENVRREKMMVPCWVRGDVERARIVSGSGKGEELTILALGGSVGTPADGVSGDVVMVRSFGQLRAMGDAAKGKIVFFNRPMPRALRNTFRAYGSAVPQRTSGAVEAARVGAIAAIVRSMTTAIDDHPHTGAMNYIAGVPKVPAVAVSTADADRLAELLDEGPVEVKLTLSCKTLPEVESANVVGEIVGSKSPEKIVLIAAHLDCWDAGQGAHDDGAGCAHVLEAGRLLLAAGIHPACTVRCT